MSIELLSSISLHNGKHFKQKKDCEKMKYKTATISAQDVTKIPPVGNYEFYFLKWFKYISILTFYNFFLTALYQKTEALEVNRIK